MMIGKSLNYMTAPKQSYSNPHRLSMQPVHPDRNPVHYTRKQHIIHSEIMLPANAPPQYMDRATLWNSVEWNETDRNAQLARVFEIALPAELSHEQNIALARKIVQDLFVSKGMCADFGVHDKKDGNPHVHGRSCRSRSVPPLKSSMRLNCASIARQRKHYSDGRTAVKPLTTRAGRKR